MLKANITNANLPRCALLSAPELCRERGGFVGQVVREQQISCAQRLVGLSDEPFGLVILGTRIGIKRLVVDSSEIIRGPRQQRADPTLELGFLLCRRCLKCSRRLRSRLFRGLGRFGRWRFGPLRFGRTWIVGTLGWHHRSGSWWRVAS